MVPRDRLVGQQEGRLSLFAARRRDHARARRPLLSHEIPAAGQDRPCGFGDWLRRLGHRRAPPPPHTPPRPPPTPPPPPPSPGPGPRRPPPSPPRCAVPPPHR